MLRLFLFSLLSIVLTLSLKPVHAQIPGSGGYPGSSGSPTWQVTLSSTGTIIAQTPTGTHTAAWNTYGETQLSGYLLSHGQSASIMTSGTYHVVIKWLMPDGTTPPASYGPPAKNVLVDTLCNMGWIGPSNLSSGFADNGLENTPVTMPGIMFNYGYDGGEKYQVMDGSSGTITYDVGEVFATVNGTMNDYYNISVSVGRSLNVSCNPINMSVFGPVRDTNNVDNILIGQRCIAGVYTQTPQASFQNYNWTISCATFKDYYVAPDASNAHVDFLTPADLISSNPTWYWLSEGSAVVTVTVDVYVNVSVNYSGLPLNTIIKIATISDSHPVTVVRPHYACVPTPGSVILWQDNPIQRFINGTPTWLEAAKPGIRWDGYVLPQPLFGAGGSGSWNLVQLITPNRSYVKSGHKYTWSINGKEGLDGFYPYPCPSDDPFNSNDGSGWKDNAASHGSNDSPLQPVFDDYTSVTVGDMFKTYLMYKPQNGTWVPLKRIDWQWNATVTQPASGSWADALGPAGSVTATQVDPCTQHPKWDYIVSATAPFNP